MKTLQSRLDWYDTNVKREYDRVRQEVQDEMAQLQNRLRDAEKVAEENRSGSQNGAALQQELDQVKLEWKLGQAQSEAQIRVFDNLVVPVLSALESFARPRSSIDGRAEALEKLALSHLAALGEWCFVTCGLPWWCFKR